MRLAASRAREWTLARLAEPMHLAAMPATGQRTTSGQGANDSAEPVTQAGGRENAFGLARRIPRNRSP